MSTANNENTTELAVAQKAEKNRGANNHEVMAEDGAKYILDTASKYLEDNNTKRMMKCIANIDSFLIDSPRKSENPLYMAVTKAKDNLRSAANNLFELLKIAPQGHAVLS